MGGCACFPASVFAPTRALACMSEGERGRERTPQSLREGSAHSTERYKRETENERGSERERD